MPPLTDLEKRLNSDPSWRKRYSDALPKAEDVADRILLVHVTSRVGRVSFDTMLRDGRQCVPTSIDAQYYSDDTRQTEADLGLLPSAYFYAGRSHPSFGIVILAFSRRVEGHEKVSATPYDTGGLNCGKIRTDPELSTPDARRKFHEESMVGKDRWRNAFAEWLAAYFASPSDYWAKRPDKSDPENMYQVNDDWRAWAWEVRVTEDVPLDALELWTSTPDYDGSLREAFSTSPSLLTDDAARLQAMRLLKCKLPNAWSMFEAFEKYMQQYVGLLVP